MWNEVIKTKVPYEGSKDINFELYQWNTEEEFFLEIILLKESKYGRGLKYKKTYGNGNLLTVLNEARKESLEMSDYIGYKQLMGVVDFIDILMFFYKEIEDELF